MEMNGKDYLVIDCTILKHILCSESLTWQDITKMAGQ